MATLDKALSLLGLFDHRQPEFGLSQLSRAAGFDKATTLRLARSLVSYGLLEQHPATRNYRLGAEVLRLANLREGLYPLRTIAHPLASQLCAKVEETVHVAARTGDRLGTVFSVESPRTVRVVVEPGLSLPWHATASGLALLAKLPRDECSRLLADCLEQHRDETRSLLPALESLDYAVSRDRFEVGVAGIAAVFYDDRDHAAGTIAVAMSSDTLTDSRSAEIGDLVACTAAEISRQLGASGYVGTRTRTSPAA